MNIEDIIRMARQAGFVWLGEYHSNLEDFAKLVAQHEREACAMTAENTSVYDRYSPEDTIADAIRARGQA